MAAGLCGICLYYLLENIALTYTQASNVSVIGSTAPFFTALLAHYFMRSAGSLSKQFIIGFFIVMSGIACISFNGAAMQLNPLGDLLAISAAVVWAFYALLTKKSAAMVILLSSLHAEPFSTAFSLCSRR